MSVQAHVRLRVLALVLLAGATLWPRSYPRRDLSADGTAAPRPVAPIALASP